MPKKYKVKDVDRSELHIIQYLNDPDYKSRMLTCNHPIPPDRYDVRVEEHLRITGVHWKFLPLLRDFVNIGQYSWGSACLAHLHRALCRASRYNCKEIDGPLTLLLGWAWIRLPYLSPLPREPRSFPLANRWRNWERGDRRYRYLKLADFRKAFDELQEGQGVPSQEQNLDKAHEEVLTGPKNLNWATAPSHSIWVMHWTNRYHYVLSELPIPSQHPLDTYMNWYRAKFGNCLALSNLVGEEDGGNEDMDEGNQDTDEGSQDMNEDNEEQEPHISPPNPLPQEQPQASNQFVPHTQFTPSFPMQQQYWGMSQFETGEGGSFSQLLGFMAADAAQSQHGHQPEFMPGRYSLDARFPGHTSSVASGGFVSVDDSSKSEGGRVDDPDDEGDGEDDEIEEFDEDEESRNDGQADTPEDNVKGYNLRIDPPRQSANRFTPSVFKKAAKKCKNFVKDRTDGICYDYVPQPHIVYIAWDDVTSGCPSHSKSASSWGDLS
ncbi:hypothetical protein Ahy_B03g068819 [Arachis hypogaea]|uniref:Aminotransferase-like plant mobile domain-containing protein n=1 Tax=Arachis hypogaea TaxID=3818 RepID=A0A445ABG5_ARAHY|nr:hypothetical protein Ahy_B03g068819 [Arachis hypogaea]